MSTGDGNGWVVCPFGHRHWGRFGAAGLLLLRDPQPRDGSPPALGSAQVLMQLRAPWTHEGGRWGLPGGARDSHESVPEAAVREAGEEAGIDPFQIAVVGTAPGADHVTWSYTYVIALGLPGLRIGPHNEESDALSWVAVDDVAGLPLHSGLAAAWEPLRPFIASALDDVAAG